MAVDEAIFNAGRERHSPPTVRVYGWKPPAVTLGYGQNLEEEVDLKRLRQYGIDLVRRQTGGRAVLHDEELTYSVTVPEGHTKLGNNAYENYRRVSEALIFALRQMDIPGALANAPASSPDGTGGACFTYAARFEITIQGRKLVGSAQRRARGYVLQHGSLLLGPGHLRLPLLLPPEQHARRRGLMTELTERTVTVQDILGRSVSFEEMARFVKIGFEQQLGMDFVETGLTHEEKAEAQRLIAEKYGADAWNTRSKPRLIPR